MRMNFRILFWLTSDDFIQHNEMVSSSWAKIFHENLSQTFSKLTFLIHSFTISFSLASTTILKRVIFGITQEQFLGVSTQPQA